MLDSDKIEVLKISLEVATRAQKGSCTETVAKIYREFYTLVAGEDPKPSRGNKASKVEKPDPIFE